MAGAYNYHALICTRNGKSASTRTLDFIGSIHDLESFNGSYSSLDSFLVLFLSHWSHLSVIFMWISGNLFHIGWTGNFMCWVLNPLSTLPISHSLWDPHLYSSYTYLGYPDSYISPSSLPSYSGLYHWLFAVGCRGEYQIYYGALSSEILSLICMVLAKVHSAYIMQGIQAYSTSSSMMGRAYRLPISSVPSVSYVLRSFMAFIDTPGLRLNFHLSSLIGVTSLLWCLHLTQVALPSSRGSVVSFNLGNAFKACLTPLVSGHWSAYSTSPDLYTHIFGAFTPASASVTFIGGLDTSASLRLSDIVHHHLALGVLLLWSGHLYSSLFKGLGHRIRHLTSVSGFSSGTYLITKSLNIQLSLALSSLSLATSVAAQEIYFAPSYPYLSYDYVTSVSLYIHHFWISSLLMVGAFVHATLFLIRDYSMSSSGEDVVCRILAHKLAIISHLSWVTLWLGFHTLGVYVHNDTVVSFGESHKQILLEPFLSQGVTSIFSLSKSYGACSSMFYLSSPSYPTWVHLSQSTHSPGDTLAYHAISLGIHVTSLILLKGSLDSRGSRLIPDKVQLGYGFSCDGPSRGGTCDVSSWDAFYLSMFWLLNSNSWLMFYFHWKHLLICQGSISRFEESSTYLNGWFRDYLWFNSAALIRGYDALGSNDLSVVSWAFLLAHLSWATGFMFLISWRGYWQELIETLVYMHLMSPYLSGFWHARFFSPQALSIVQARFLGLVHFSVGLILTYGAFVLGSTS